jgi:hypothetical protein
MQDDLTRLVKPAPAAKRLPAATTPRALRAQTGLEPRRSGDVNTAVVTVESTDGLFSFTVTVLK